MSKLKHPTGEAAAYWVRIDDVTPWDRNPRDNEAAVAKVATSLERFGFGAPLIARSSDGVLIAGHTRLKAAKKLGMDKVPVRYLDLKPDQAAALALADNRLGELAEWDDAALREVLTSLGDDALGLGWDKGELAKLLDVEIPEDLDVSIDDIPEVWEVLVNCEDEQEQAKVMELLEQGGFPCRALIS